MTYFLISDIAYRIGLFKEKEGQLPAYVSFSPEAWIRLNIDLSLEPGTVCGVPLKVDKHQTEDWILVKKKDASVFVEACCERSPTGSWVCDCRFQVKGQRYGGIIHLEDHFVGKKPFGNVMIDLHSWAKHLVRKRAPGAKVAMDLTFKFPEWMGE
jgi:hypothetical protein